jgi:hypothetical protein
MNCENHLQMKAVGTCVICGKPVCGDCSISHDGKTFCDDAMHSNILDAYVLFAETETIYDADLITKNLHSNGIECLSFNQAQYDVTNHPTIYVVNQKYAEAETTLQSLDLLDFIILKTDGK